MKSKTIFTKSIQEINIQIKETIKDDFTPTLAIVFASLSCDTNELKEVLNKYQIQFIGATTAGEIGNKAIQSGGISLLLLDLDKSFFKIEQRVADYTNSYEMGKELAISAKASFQNPAFLVLFSLNISGEALIEGMTDESLGLPSIFGGMAGDDLKMQNTYTFSNQKNDNNLVTVLILDNDKIAVEGMALSGWQPIGVENCITKAKDNIIYEINGEPALEVVKKYFGDYYKNSLNGDSVSLGAAQYPLQINRGDNFVLRAALTANEIDGSLKMAGPVNQGDNFRFSIAPGFEVVEDTIEGFKNYAIKQPEADALIMISCIARHMSLGPLIEEEVEGIYEVWNKPMVGFFSYGEVGQQEQGVSHFYNETCSLVLLKEL